MGDLIRRESLKQRINLNYNSHQYIDTQSIKDIINTEPSVEDKTVEELKTIKAEIEKLEHLNIEDGSDGYDKYVEQYEVLTIINKRIAELKG